MIIILLVLIISVFHNPVQSGYYVSKALILWFEQMIPALFPFMLLSGIIVRKNYSLWFSRPFYPIIGKLFRITPTMCTTMLLGFLFGFPLGAKTIADQYQLKQLTKEQAQFLLAFCNNIGPIYMLSFAIPLFQLPKAVLLIHLLLPFLYGLALRHTLYKSIPFSSKERTFATSDTITAIDDSVISSCNAILRLGGYMVFFIIWNLPLSQWPLPTILKSYLPALLEITSGLSLCQKPSPALVMIFITFSGLSCYAQTYTCMRETDLNFKEYCIHKGIQTTLAVLIYGVFFSVFSST